MPPDKLGVTVPRARQHRLRHARRPARPGPAGAGAGRPGAARRPGRRGQPDDDGLGGVVTTRCGWSCRRTTRRPGSAPPWRALAAQTDTDFHLLVVDNGSADGTAADRPGVRAGRRPGAGDRRAGEGRGLRRRHRFPVRDRARRDDARPHRRRLPAAARLARGGPGRVRGRRRAGLRPDHRAPRRARRRRPAPASARWSRSPRHVRPAAARPTAAPATWRPTGCTPATTWRSPPRCTRRAAACPGARRRPTGRSSTGCAGPPRDRAQPGDGGGELDPAAGRIRDRRHREVVSRPRQRRA